MPTRFLAIVLLGLATLLPAPAHADQRQGPSFGAWRVMDTCAKQANKQFPDHTPEANAQREAARQECLRANRLPVTAPVVPPPQQ